MQSDRQIKLVIGEPATGTIFYASQALLEFTSEYFRSALRNQHLGNVQKDTLSFPDDELNSWKVLLFWIVARELPSVDEICSTGSGQNDDGMHSVYVRCWVLGDKYDIPAFQDLIMLELLKTFHYGSTLTIENPKLALENTPPGSVLRELVVEEVLNGLQSKVIDCERLDELDGIVGFMSRVMMKRNGLYQGEVFSSRLPIANGSVTVPYHKGKSPYTIFMVGGDVPRQHWLHDGLSKAKEHSTARGTKSRWD